jgi:SAM-dependent methyltransferase
MSHHPPHDGRPDEEGPALAELLELEAEVLHAFRAEVTGWLQRLAADTPPRRILDLGAGTGTGAIALAELFPDAEVVAVDSSEQMLSRVRDKAGDLGLADRVVTILADLDAAWPPMAAVDVVWASMSLHHLTDPVRVLSDALATLRPGGLLTAVEMDAPLRFLPDDIGIGRPGLEGRCHAALAEERAISLPHLGADWGALLEQAGFVPITERTFTIDQKPPGSTAAGRYAQASFSHGRSGLEGRLDAADLAVLDTLIGSHGPASLLRRDDLNVRGTRTVWVGKRP